MSYPYPNPYGSTYYSPGGTSSPYGNQQPQAAAFVPGAGALNFTNFHSNTQSQPPAPSFPFSTASFPPEVLKQFANSNLPPPPPGFPPVPPLNLNFPPFPPPPVALNQGQSYSPSQHNAQDEIEDAYDPHFPQSILQNSRPSTIGRSQSTQNQNQDLAQTALEKGGRFDLAQLLPNLDAGTVFSSQRLPNPEPSKTSPSRDTTMGNTISEMSQYEAQQREALSKRQEDNENARDDSTAQREVDAPSARAAPDYDSMNPKDLREAAKVALGQFAQFNITYDDLVGEGINSDVLRTLYDELGIQVKPSPPTQAENKQPDAPIAKESTEDQLQKDAATQPTSAANPSLERKDRIALLLAAKAGKPTPLRTTSQELPPTASASITISSVTAANNQAANQSVKATALRSEELHEAGSNASSDHAQRGNLIRPATARVPITHPPATFSNLPGLGMTSIDSDVESNTTPAKRPLDDQENDQESSRKRRNTGLSSRDDTDMEIDESSQEASEGEVVESPQPVQALKIESNAQAVPVDVQKPILPPTKPFSPILAIKLTPEQLSEKARELKAKLLEKRARQQASQEIPPDTDSDVINSEKALAQQRSRMQEIRQRIAGLETDLTAARKEEDEQVIRIQRAEEVLRERIADQKRAAEQLSKLKETQSTTSGGPGGMQQSSASDAAVPLREQEEPLPAESQILPRVTTTSSNTPRVQTADVDVSFKASGTNTPVIVDTAPVTSGNSMDRAAETTDQAMQSTAQTDSHNHMPSNGDSNFDSGEASRAAVSPDEEMNDDDRSDGSASMMDSASETSHDEGEYSPPEEDTTQPMDLDDGASEEYDPADAIVDIEPEEDVQNDRDETSNGVEEQPRNELPSPPTEEDNGNVAGDEHAELRQEYPSGPEAAFGETGRSNGYGHNAKNNYRSYARSAPATPNGRWAPHRPALKPLSNNDGHRSTSFSAYESPLTSFPSYRYNENFSDAAKQGYRSLTYSNNIDPKIPLCPTELSGETCQDATCEEQHFRHLGLTDDKILVSMSSASEFTDKDTRDRYLLGLKGIIADLRARNVRGFEDVAAALSEYRRKFVSSEQ